MPYRCSCSTPSSHPGHDASLSMTVVPVVRSCVRRRSTSDWSKAACVFVAVVAISSRTAWVFDVRGSTSRPRGPMLRIVDSHSTVSAPVSPDRHVYPPQHSFFPPHGNCLLRTEEAPLTRNSTTRSRTDARLVERPQIPSNPVQPWNSLKRWHHPAGSTTCNSRTDVHITLSPQCQWAVGPEVGWLCPARMRSS